MVAKPSSEARGPGGRGAGLDRDTIVRVALHLMDEQGVAAFTMRALGRELGVKAQALYWHFDDRESLCAAVVEHLRADLTLPEQVDGTPRERLRAHLGAIREHWISHPTALELNASHVPSVAGAVTDTTVALIVELGASRADAFEYHRSLMWALVGFVRVEASLPTSAHHHATGHRRYRVEIPHSAEDDDAATLLDTDATFDLMLGLLLDGLEARIA